MQDYFPNLVDTIRTKLCWANFVVLDKIILSNKINKVSETKDIVKFLRKNFGLIMKSNMLTKGRKISMIF